MIRFCDKNVVGTGISHISEEYLRNYYSYKNHEDDILGLSYGDDSNLIGFVEFFDNKYDLITESVNIGESFWLDAKAYFAMHSSSLLPVMKDGELVTFGYDDPDYNYYGGDFAQEYLIFRLLMTCINMLIILRKVSKWSTFLALMNLLIFYTMFFVKVI